MLQCVAVCCSVLQCEPSFLSRTFRPCVLNRVPVGPGPEFRPTILRCVAAKCSQLHRVLQSVAMYCSCSGSGIYSRKPTVSSGELQ